MARKQSTTKRKTRKSKSMRQLQKEKVHSREFRSLQSKLKKKKLTKLPGRQSGKVLRNTLSPKQKTAAIKLLRMRPSEFNDLKKENQYFGLSVGNTGNVILFRTAEQMEAKLQHYLTEDEEEDTETPLELAIFDYSAKIPRKPRAPKQRKPTKKPIRKSKLRPIGSRFGKRVKRTAKTIKKSVRKLRKGYRKSKRFVKRTSSNARKLARKVQPPVKRQRRVKHAKRRRVRKTS